MASDTDTSSVYSDLENELEPETSDDEENDPSSVVDKFDSSDEEDLRNTIGNIPIQWYDDKDHIGYSLSGQKILKGPKMPPKSEIDKFLQRIEDPDFWKKVRDVQTGEDVTLTTEHLDTLNNLRQGRYPDSSYNPYEPFVDFFTHEVMKHPVTNRLEDKRSFIPSKAEKEKVSRMVHAIKMGWIKPRKPKTEKDEGPPLYDLWASEKATEDQNLSKSRMARLHAHIPAPKLKLPGHEESYNPPPEYLLTPQEEEAWRETELDARKLDFIPQKFSSLREVPAYSQFVQERFQRCLDLYLAPRQRKMKLNVNPEDLLPKLPNPEDLRPFPTMQAIFDSLPMDLDNITGNLELIKDETLRNIMARGTKYRPSKPLNWHLAKSELLSSLQRYGQKIADKYNINIAEFHPWMNMIKQKLDDLDDKMIRIQSSWKSDNLRLTPAANRELTYMKERYIITSVDKASQNYSFICKKLYAITLKKELAQADTYLQIDIQKEELIKNLCHESNSIWNIPVEEGQRLLPFMQLVPKFHKNPTKFRVIVSSKRASTNPASRKIGFGLRKVLSRLKGYCKMVSRWHNGVNPFWIINSNKPILERLADLNLHKDAKTINTYDFGQLYTSLEHNVITTAITNSNRIGFGDNSRRLALHNNSANFCNQHRSGISFNHKEFSDLIVWLIDSTYFTCGDKIYKQIRGIPMGTSCGPFIADITLFWPEYSYVMEQLKQKGGYRIQHIRQPYRYIDDITLINDNDTFENIYKDIYPDSLTLNKMNVSNKEADVLDITIRIKNQSFVTNVYDKRDHFGFTVNKLPDLRGNISNNCAYNVFGNEIVRIDDLQKALESSRKDVTEAQELHADLLKHYDKLKAKFDETSAQRLAMEEEAKDLRRQLNEANTMIKRTTAISEKLEASLASKEEEVGCLEQNVEQLQDALNSLEQEKKANKKKISELDKLVDDKSGQIREQEKTIASLKKSMNKYSDMKAMLKRLAEDDVGS